MSNKSVFDNHNLCPPRIGTRLNDIFGQEASNLLMCEGLIILAKTSQHSCDWFAAGKEVCKDYIQELDWILLNQVMHHKS